MAVDHSAWHDARAIRNGRTSGIIIAQSATHATGRWHTIFGSVRRRNLDC